MMIPIKHILKRFLNTFYTTLFLVNKKGLRINLGKNVLLKDCSTPVMGGNSLIIEKDARLMKCQFFLYDNNNRIVIHKNARINNITIWMEDDNNLIEIGCEGSESIGSMRR